MLITLDIGNSQISCVLFEAGARVAGWRLPTDTRRTADEYGLVLESMMAEAGIEPSACEGAVLSSVVPALNPVFVALATSWTGRAPIVLGPGTASGMALRYDPPTALGADRLADAVGAVARFGSPVVVVDMGTATTFNVVDGSGAYVGGAIAPGVSVMAEALVRSGARLSAVDMTAGPGVGDIGRSTEQAVRLGVMHGHAGLVDGMLRRIARELGDPPRSALPVVATGGWSGAVAPLVARIDHVVPDLLVEGLRVIYERNAPSAAASAGRGARAPQASPRSKP